MADLNAIETRVAIVEKELGTVYGVFSRFETAIEKITDISGSLKELIAVHDNRLMEREKADLTIFEMIEKRKEEYSRGLERMYQKVEDISGDLRKEVRNEINENYDELKEAVDGFNKGVRELAERMDKRIDQQVEHRDVKIKELTGQIDKLDLRVKSLENWRWMVLGAVCVVGYFLGRVQPIASLFSMGAN